MENYTKCAYVDLKYSSVVRVYVSNDSNFLFFFFTCREVTHFMLPATCGIVSGERDQVELKPWVFKITSNSGSVIYTWSGKESRPPGMVGWLGSSWTAPAAGNDTNAGASSKRRSAGRAYRIKMNGYWSSNNVRYIEQTC